MKKLNMSGFEALAKDEMMAVDGGSIIGETLAEVITWRATHSYTYTKRGKNGGGAVVSYTPTEQTKAYASKVTKWVGKL